MSQLWNVYKADEATIGPLSAAEIRDALRAGEIDPFDQVGRVGSNVRQTLVEVDEIFAEVDAMPNNVDSVYDQPDTNHAVGASVGMQTTVDMGRGFSPGVATVPAQKPGQYTPPQRYEQATAKPQKISKPRRKSPKRHAKRFIVIDGLGRRLGPLSAAEVQSLYYRGVLDSNVKVLKDGGGRKVSVQQFVAAYVGAKAKKFKSEKTRVHLDKKSDHWAYPNSRVMEQIKRTAVYKIKRNKRLPYVSIIVVVIAIIAAFFAVDAVRKSNFTIFKKSVSRKKVRSQPINNQQPDVIVVDRQQQLSKPPPRFKAQKQKVKNRASAKGKLKRPIRKKKKRRPSSVKKRSRGRSLRSRSRPPPRASSSRSASRRSTRGRGGGYAAKVGQVVTISGARYSTSSLGRCGMKCTLTFRDSKGTSVRGVFFKAQFEAALKRKGGRAKISGRLNKKGATYVMYLQSVR